MTLTTRRLTTWALSGLATVLGALLTAAAAEAWGLPARVTTLEADDKSNHEIQMEMRQDIKDIRAWLMGPGK